MKESRVVRLKDGRRLGLAQYGNPEGKPVFFFHGWPGARFTARECHKTAKELDAHIISLDRPGYGLSDFQPRRRLLDWPDDVAEVAEQMGIKKFAVLGVSGGAPYAAACAYKIPHKITKVGIVVGLGPMHVKGAFKGVSWTGKIGWDSATRRPILIKLVPLVILVRTKLLGGKFEKVGMGYEDRKLFSKALRKELLAIRREAVAQGVKGLAHDLKIYTSSWGFTVKNIKPRVHLWYGSEDRNVSMSMGQYYAANIPNNIFTVYSREGHLLLRRHSEEILGRLIS